MQTNATAIQTVIVTQQELIRANDARARRNLMLQGIGLVFSKQRQPQAVRLNRQVPATIEQ